MRQVSHKKSDQHPFLGTLPPGREARKRKLPEHKHRWEVTYSIGIVTLGLECPCGEKMERPATKAESRKLKADQDYREAESAQMHKANWDFDKNFKDEKGWKYKSYDLMTRVRKWAKEWPKDVIVCRIDDSHNANSDLVFVLHRVGRRLWGTTCYTITQCDGQPPNEWFMYPGHRAGIQKALQVMAGFRKFYKDW